jgi:hypothetical protein
MPGREPRLPRGEWAVAYDAVLGHRELGVLDRDDQELVWLHVRRARAAAAEGDHGRAEEHLTDARLRAVARHAEGLADAIGRLRAAHRTAARAPVPLRPLPASARPADDMLPVRLDLRARQ